MLVLPVPTVITAQGRTGAGWPCARPTCGWETAVTFVNYELMASPVLFVAFFLATAGPLRPMGRRARVVYSVVLGIACAAAQLYLSVSAGAVRRAAGGEPGIAGIRPVVQAAGAGVRGRAGGRGGCGVQPLAASRRLTALTRAPSIRIGVAAKPQAAGSGWGSSHPLRSATGVGLNARRPARQSFGTRLSRHPSNLDSLPHRRHFGENEVVQTDRPPARVR